MFLIELPMIKTQTVFFFIHNVTELCLQAPALGRIQQAFNNRTLPPQALVDTLLRNSAQTFASRGVFCVDIVGD